VRRRHASLDELSPNNLDRGRAIFDPALGIDTNAPRFTAAIHTCETGMTRTTVVVVAAAVSVLAACGGGSPAHRSSQQSSALAYAQCLRSNGVRNWPDPDGSGVFDKSKLTLQQLGVAGSQLVSAQNACQHLLPNGGNGPSRAQQQQMKAQALAFSRCVRDHGVPNFPDPGGDGRIPEAWPGVNQGSPTFEAANNACAKYRPPYIPSNAAYNTWARTHPNGS
jgi:hypothetical protein